METLPGTPQLAGAAFGVVHVCARAADAAIEMPITVAITPAPSLNRLISSPVQL
jgi:hypothetical protein